ncbi:hypothetical protein D3C76_1633620 [compost metagenome]
MSDSPHSFVVGFTRALEKRAKERTKQQAVQVQKIDISVSDVVASDAIITEQDHDELYKQTIVTKMIALIKQREVK